MQLLLKYLNHFEKSLGFAMSLVKYECAQKTAIGEDNTKKIAQETCR